MTEGQQPVAYLPVNTRYTMRGRQVYQRSDTPPITSCTHVASIRIISTNTITLRSQSTLDYEPLCDDTPSLHQALHKAMPCMLLCGLTLMGDGEWLLHSFRQGSPIACHSGSFMPILNDQYCMAATLFPCKQSGNIAMITYCEKMEQEVASNYHGELIGGVIATSILRTLTTLVPNHGQHTYELFCDNMGVVSHGNDIYKPLHSATYSYCSGRTYYYPN